jgi:hypothetical protein
VLAERASIWSTTAPIRCAAVRELRAGGLEPLDELETASKAFGNVCGKVQFGLGLYRSENGSEFFKKFGWARPRDAVKPVTHLARVVGETFAREAVGQKIEECVELVE